MVVWDREFCTICESHSLLPPFVCSHVACPAMLCSARLLADRTGISFIFLSLDEISYLYSQLNRLFGRRGTIFITALFSFLTCIWQGVTNSWPHLFIARFVLGIGIGPKSSTVPVYAAECKYSQPPSKLLALTVHPHTRRSSSHPGCIGNDVVGVVYVFALYQSISQSVLRQTWTAFGIMLGFVADLAFFKVPDPPHIRGLNWRLMLASVSFYQVGICFRSRLKLYIGWCASFIHCCSGVLLS